jgi:hypothetical protein
MVYFFSLILAFCSAACTHDFKLSMLNFYVEDNELAVEFRFEKNDLIASINQNSDATNVLPSEEQIQFYLAAQTTLKINEKAVQLDLASTRIEEDHIHLLFAKVEVPSQIKSIHFFNTSLLDKFNDQIHIIQIHQKDKELRGFQMDKDRTSILVEL